MRLDLFSASPQVRAQAVRHPPPILIMLPSAMLFLAATVPAAGAASIARGTTAFDTRQVGDATRFLQCDRRWGNEIMGVKGPGEQATICKEGCAMTSLTMALHDLGLYINDTELDPGVMNAWLQANNGYVCDGGDCNNLVLDAPERIPGSPLVFMGEKPKPPLAELEAWADNATREVVLAHVHNSGHFVLLRPGRPAPGVFNVLDPFFNVSTYPYANISDVIHYHVARTDGAVGTYPTFKQCAAPWGSHVMGANNDTVCEVGCLMSSVSAALSGHNIDVMGAPADPGALNTFLQLNGGYDSGSDLKEEVVPKVNIDHIKWPADGMHVHADLSPDEVAGYLGTPPASNKHRVVIANVLHGGHFVLVQGLGGKNSSGPEAAVFVHDSGFARGIYSFSEVVGWRIFDMTRAPNTGGVK